MKISRWLIAICLAGIYTCQLLNAQQPTTSQTITTVPRLVNFSGKATDAQGKTLAGVAGVTFSIYKEQDGGAPLWMETQNIHADAKGNYIAQLGATLPQGIPLDLFSTSEARWLGVRINGGEEQPRVLLLSVPYALKAADAETVGGFPASAFLRATPGNNMTTVIAPALASSSAVTPTVSGTGTTDFVPLWTNATGALGNSVLFQSGSGATAKIGIDTTTPATTLDVAGTSTLRGAVTLPATAAATTAAGKGSQSINFTASAFNSSTAAAVNENFRWQAESSANNTATPSGTLNLLFASGTAAPHETGLKIASTGVITFATGQTFPGGSGGGSVTSVGLAAPTTDFTVSGSPVTGAGTLNFKWKVAPTNANTANAIVKRDATGSFTAGAITGTLGVTGINAGGGVGGVTGQNSSAGYGVLGTATGNAGQGVWGESFGTLPNTDGTGPDGIHGISHSNLGSGVAGLNTASGGTGIYGSGIGVGVYGIAAANGLILGNGTGVYGTSFAGTGVFGSGGGNAFVAQGHASQDRTSGGWVKAMVQWNGESGTAMRCYNSTLIGANATTPPCGFTVTSVSNGILIDFGFEVDDRFYSATMARCLCGTKIPELFATPSNSNPNQLTLGLFEAGTANIITGNINLIVF